MRIEVQPSSLDDAAAGIEAAAGGVGEVAGGLRSVAGWADACGSPEAGEALEAVAIQWSAALARYADVIRLLAATTAWAGSQYVETDASAIPSGDGG